jgi:hypothetical protein
MPNIRNSVFISYSHADAKWLTLLNTHLQPLVRDQKLQIWSDKDIRKGERWRDRIRRQLAQARVAIFLVSADFLASDFIHSEELPPLLDAANKEGSVLLSVIVRPCAFRDSPLSKLQSVNNPSQPLSGMNKTQREHVMLSVYEELRRIFPPNVGIKAKTTLKRPTTPVKATSKEPTRTKRLVTKANTASKSKDSPKQLRKPATKGVTIAKKSVVASKQKSSTSTTKKRVAKPSTDKRNSG